MVVQSVGKDGNRHEGQEEETRWPGSVTHDSSSYSSSDEEEETHGVVTGNVALIWLVTCTACKESSHVSDNLGLVDFAIGLVISILNLNDGQMKFFEGIQIKDEL